MTFVPGPVFAFLFAALPPRVNAGGSIGTAGLKPTNGPTGGQGGASLLTYPWSEALHLLLLHVGKGEALHVLTTEDGRDHPYKMMEETTPLQDQTSQLQVEIFGEEDDHRAVLQLSGEVDLATVQSVVTAFVELADRRLTEVVIDTSRVTFMDSTGLHALTDGKKRIHEVGSEIALIVSPQVRRVLELVFPEHLFAVRVDTMEQAREALGWD